MILLLASSAFAMCAQPDPWMSPVDGAVDVPLDARIVWGTVETVEEGTPAVTDALEGAEVPVTITWTESASSAKYATIVPVSALAPNTTYRVADARHTYTFTTGNATGADVPDTPTLTTTEAEAEYGTIEDCDGASVWVEDQEHVYVTLTPEAPLDGWLEARVSVDGGAETIAYGPEALALAWGGCRANNLSGMKGAQQIAVSVRAVGYNGAASDWSDPVTVDVGWPEVEECPHASCGGGPGLLAGLPLLVGLGWRRRRR